MKLLPSFVACTVIEVLQLLAQPLLAVHLQYVVTEGVRAVAQGACTEKGHHTEVACILKSQNSWEPGPYTVRQLSQHSIVPGQKRTPAGATIHGFACHVVEILGVYHQTNLMGVRDDWSYVYVN